MLLLCDDTDMTTWTLTSHSVLNCFFKWAFNLHFLSECEATSLLDFLLWRDNYVWIYLKKKVNYIIFKNTGNSLISLILGFLSDDVK